MMIMEMESKQSMNRTQRVTLADAILAIRPDWQQAGVLAQLEQLERTWDGTDATLSAFAMGIAADAKVTTPGAFNATPRETRRTVAHQSAREERCYICGNTRSRCFTLHDAEVRNGVPDPHDFETSEQAEANAARNQIATPELIEAREAARAAVRDTRPTRERDRRAYEEIEAKTAEQIAALEADRQRQLAALIAERDPIQ